MTSHQLTSSILQKFIETAVPRAEGIRGNTDPYRASFATGDKQKQAILKARAQDPKVELPKSGLSFGRFQHDVANNDDAKTLFETILNSWSYFQTYPLEKDKALKAADTEGVTRTEFAATGLLDEVDAALKHSSADIDQADNKQLQVLVGAIDKGLVNSPAPPIGRGVFDPSHPDYLIAVGYVAAWNNRVSDINNLIKYMRGNEVEWGGEKHKLTAAPTLQDVIDYIGTQLEFRYDNRTPPEVNVGKFKNWQLLVVEGVTEGYKQLGLPKPDPSRITLGLTSPFPKDIHNVKNQPAVSGTQTSPAGSSPAHPAQPPISIPTAPPSRGVPPLPFSPMLPLTPQSFPGGGGGGTELEMDGRQASVVDGPAAMATAQRSSPLRDILTRAKQRASRALTGLTPTAFARTSASTAGLDAEATASDSGGAQPSLPAVLPTLDQGSTIDLRRADADQVDAGQVADGPDADSHFAAASFDTPSAPVGAPTNAAATRPGWPHSVTVGGRVFTREEVMAMTQVTISADGRSSKWTIPQPGDTPETTGLTERMKEQVRELIREEQRERDRRSGADYRSTHRFRRP